MSSMFLTLGRDMRPALFSWEFAIHRLIFPQVLPFAFLALFHQFLVTGLAVPVNETASL
jgi:hypothetical protein